VSRRAQDSEQPRHAEILIKAGMDAHRRKYEQLPQQGHKKPHGDVGEGLKEAVKFWLVHFFPS